MDQLLKKKILKKIKVKSIDDKIYHDLVDKFVKKLRLIAKKSALKCEFFVGGSFAKGTYLKNSFDVDLFCRFDLSYDDSKLSSYLELILSKSKLKYKIQKGSRDYFSVIYGPKDHKILFEIIPNKNISEVSKAMNTTDLSPFHVSFLKEKILENPLIADEIRLSKQYFKAKKLYGAESYINGFSGHTIDILIAYYSSLENLFNDAKTWTEQKFIDINSNYKNDLEIEKKLSSDKLSPLVIIDPIIPNRNASRALSYEKYNEFLFLVNTHNEFVESDFELEIFDEKKIITDSKQISIDTNLDLIIYNFKIKLSCESEDIAGSKMLKIFKKVKKYYQSFDFKLFDSEFFIDINKGICIYVYFFEKSNLPKLKTIYGPKVHMREAISKFLKNRSSYFIEDGRVCVYETRIINNISEIYKLSLEDFQKMANKDISFIKSIRSMKR